MMSRPRGSSIKDGARLANDRFRDEEDQSRSCKNGSNRYHFGMTRPRDEEASRNGRDHRDHSDEDADALYKKSRQHFGAWDFKDIVQDDRLGQRKQTDRFEDPRLTNGRSRNDVDREQSRRSRRKEGWEDAQRADERDQLLREIENLAVEGRSPDRRIRAMIERFKTREEDKLRSRRERDEQSPEKDGSRSKSVGRGDARNDHEDRVNDRGTRIQKDDRESGRLKIRETEHEEAGRSRSVDRRADKFNGFEDSRRNNGSERSHRRRSRELEDEGLPRRKDSPKRRSYAYEGNPEDFDVRIQRYERALLEPRRDAGIEQKASLEDHDRQATRKSSFKKSRDRESSLGRKASFKNSSRDVEKKYFGKDPNTEHASRKNSFKEGSDYGRIASRNRDDEEERKNPSKGHAAGVSRITFKERSSDLGRKNSFKEKTVEFAGVSYEDQAVDGGFKGFDDSRKRHSPNGRYVEFGTVSFQTQDEEDQDKDWSTRRRPSARSKSHDSFEKRSDRHSRPLTPPKRAPDPDPEGSEDPRAEDFDARSWHESNRHFAVKYLRENGRFRSNPEGHSEIERDPSPETGLQEFTNDQEASFQDDQALTRERNGATIIRIRSSPETTVERRRRRRPPQDTHAGRRRRYDAGDEEDDSEEDEDEHRRRRSSRGVPTPSRRIWNYREGGVLITDVEEGQPCLQCGETCSGFSPHTWRSLVVPNDEDRGFRVILNDKLQRRHTTPQLLAGAGPRMSPKGPSQEGPKVEVRVSCATGPGGEPQGIRVKIPEPKKRPMSPPMLETMRARCPSVPEKEFYRKTSSLDRRDRYPTLSGAEIKRGMIPGSVDAPRGKRNPMLDRKNRFPTISGAELKRSIAIGRCPLEDGLDLSLAPWPGMKWACVRVLHLYCKVFDQFELFELIVRKNCTSCKCPREAHDVCHEEWVSVRSRLGLKGDESSLPVGFDPRKKGLAWAPPGLPAHKVEEYFSMLPEISVPRLGTPGERYRDRQLAIQLPKQDLATAYCRHLNPKRASSADDFMAARNEIALDIGNVQEVLECDIDCGACHAPLEYGSLAVSASKLDLLYHPRCFRCSECKELLVDLAYCVHYDTLFCERHYAEQLKPRCAACDELIFSGEYTKAMNKDWHSGHFCCWQCDESLTGQRYVLRDEHPYCIKCYESVFANGCEECNKIIGIDSKDLSYKDKHWHEACFLCNRCRVSLVDKQFGSKVDKIYCGNCYDAQFASRCDGCGEIFRAGTKKMEYKTRQWHEKCFCCVVCKNPIGTKSFIPREQEIYCAGCYEDKFATRCVKCNKIITSGGVTYKNEPWHRDCFTCSNCNNSLAGQRFTSRDDKPYCADCFGELFAKRCTACSKPITGIGGTRFISFEDRHWHNDCFICAGCKTSLVGRGFITDNEDIICPECAKMKLM